MGREELLLRYECAAEWRVIIGWCDEHGAEIEAAWPRRERQGIEAALGAR